MNKEEREKKLNKIYNKQKKLEHLNKEFPEYPVGTIYQDISTLFDDGEVDFYTKTEDGWVFSHRSNPQLFLYETNRTEKNQCT